MCHPSVIKAEKNSDKVDDKEVYTCPTCGTKFEDAAVTTGGSGRGQGLVFGSHNDVNLMDREEDEEDSSPNKMQMGHTWD